MRGASIVLIFIWSLAATVFSLEFGSWENVQYTRTVDLLKGYIKETALIQLKNIGDSPNNEYYLTLNDGIGEITKLSAFVTTLSEQPVVINAEEIEDHDENINAHLFKLTLPAPIAPGSTIEIRARYIYISGYEPLPARIEMHETQSLLIKLNKFAYSPYVTKAYSLIFTGVSKGQEMDVNYNTYGTDLTFTNPEELPAAEAFLPRVEGNTLVYGPTTQDLPPFSTQPMGLQYEHNLPLKHVYNLQRSIWIPASNADKVNVEEYYELTNKGASLTKGFLRVDWMKGRYESTRNHWAISQLEVKLPDTTPEGIYYTDKVGVVDTKKVYQGFLVLQPRYPIFGEWNYNFTIGWYSAVGEFVHKLTALDQEDTYMVQFPLLSTIQDITYDNVEVSFYLPEDAEFVGVSSAIDYKSIEIGNDVSYLDVSEGHVKVTLTFENLVDDLSRVNLYLQYKYTAASYWTKVFKISGFVFIGLISYHLLTLIDISIDDKKEE